MWKCYKQFTTITYEGGKMGTLRGSMQEVATTGYYVTAKNTVVNFFIEMTCGDILNLYIVQISGIF
jgi:hypothetical protein